MVPCALVNARVVDDGGRVDMLTHRPFVFLLLIGGGDPDCRALFDNAITELAANLFDKLTNLKTLYVPRTIAIECCTAPSHCGMCCAVRGMGHCLGATRSCGVFNTVLIKMALRSQQQRWCPARL